MPPSAQETVLPVDSPSSSKLPILFLYGSETGNAEGICHELYAAACSGGYNAKIATLNQYEGAGFLQAPVVVIVCSTTGDAEPPDNARKFVKWLKKKAHPSDLLRGMQYSILALGDTNYAAFCQAGRFIDQKMRDLGATVFQARGDADEAVGLEAVVEPWKERLWASMPTCALPDPPAEQAPPPVVPDRPEAAGTDLSVGRDPAPESVGGESGVQAGPGALDPFDPVPAAACGAPHPAEDGGPPPGASLPPPPPPLLFLYGSETGTAEGLCHDLHLEAGDRGHPAMIAALNHALRDEASVFLGAPLVVIVCSTTGDGEAPESARKFVRWLKKKAHPPDLLRGMQYSVLALGDTNYTAFCQA